MNIETVEVHVEREAYMKPVMDADDKTEAYVIGKVKEKGSILDVSLKDGGGTRFFCPKHERMFHPLKACPGCMADPLPQS